jgi:hypothetical protein
VAFRFSNSTAVAAGTFNIYVIQPQWLSEVKIFREGMKLQMASDFRRPGFRYSAEELSVVLLLLELESRAGWVSLT